MEINSKTDDFIEKYRHEDVHRLAFLGDRYPDVDLPWALQQIMERWNGMLPTR